MVTGISAMLSSGIGAAGNTLAAFLQRSDHREELPVDGHFLPDGAPASIREIKGLWCQNQAALPVRDAPYPFH